MSFGQEAGFFCGFKFVLLSTSAIQLLFVMPAEAGIQKRSWVPACAGTTNFFYIQSNLICAVLITSPHFTRSFLMVAANSAGELPTICVPVGS